MNDLFSKEFMCRFENNKWGEHHEFFSKNKNHYHLKSRGELRIAKLLDHLYLLEIELKMQKDKKKLKQKMGNSRNHLEIMEIDKKIFKIYKKFHIENFKQTFSFSQKEILICIDNLQRLKLCEYPQDEVETEVITSALLKYNSKAFKLLEYELDYYTEFIKSYFSNKTLVRLTILGATFIKACTSESNESNPNN
jgi:hypothetical protein